MKTQHRFLVILFFALAWLVLLPGSHGKNLASDNREGKHVDKSMFILYVADQGKSRAFYQNVLGRAPVLDVPGMTEFRLSENASLGLMPEEGMAKLLGDAVPHPAKGSGIPRCELYLFVADPNASYQRLVTAGGKGISPPEKRPWGDLVAYGTDLDGHVLAFAKKANS